MRPLLFLFLALATSATLPAAEPASLNVRVLGKNDAPVAGAKLSIHLWTGTWDPAGIEATTDADGQAELNGIKSETYLTVGIQATGYASTALDMELASGEKREVSVPLRRPVSGTVKVLDQTGQPLAGAVISFLNFSAGEGGALFHRHATDEPFPFQPSTSNQQGIIQLPPMPDAAKVSLEVFHPDYLPKRIEDLEAIDGQLTTAQLEKGTQLKFNFTTGGGLTEMPKELRVTTMIGIDKKNSAGAPGLYLPMRLSENRWHCTIVPAEYERIDLGSLR